MTSARLPAPTLHSRQLLLRPITEDDAGDLYGLHTDREVLRYWDSPAWEDRTRADRFVETCHRLAVEGTGARVAITRSDDGSFVGWTGLSSWDTTHRSARLTYCLARASWGQGLATEATAALLGWGFDRLDLHRVQAEADTRNAASRRVLEKLGFTLEGTLREDCMVDGEVSDSWVFGLLRPQWSAQASSASTSTS